MRVNGAFIKINCPRGIQGGNYDIQIKILGYETVHKTINISKASGDDVVIQFNDIGFLSYIHNVVENSVLDPNNLILIASKNEIEKVTELGPITEEYSDITGIEYFTNLKELNLDGNMLTDYLDLTPISNLINLEKVNMEWAWISNNLEALSQLTNLKELNIKYIIIHGDSDSHFINNEDLDFLYNLDKITNQYSENKITIIAANNKKIFNELFIKNEILKNKFFDFKIKRIFGLHNRILYSYIIPFYLFDI